jgi:PAS domain S-box-containing protein
MLPDIRIRQRDFMLEIIRAITQELDLDRVLEQILRISVDILNGQAGIIMLPGGGRMDSPSWRIAASVGVAPTFLESLASLLKEFPPTERSEQALLPEIDRRLRTITRRASQGWLASLGLPMVARGNVVGAAYIYRSGPVRFTEDERALLQSFADQAAIAVSNARLFALVREEKQRLDAILDSSAEGIAILGPDNRVQRFNRTISRLAGVPAEKAIGGRHDDLLRFRNIETGRTLSQAEAGGWPLSDSATLYLEADLIRESGGPLSVGVTYAPVFTPERSLLNIVVGMRDLTRFREAEEMKDTFISIISHELKTPVALIKGYASTLRREDVQWDPNVVKDSLSVIEDEADRLGGLIEDLLDASRLQAGGLKPHYGEADLARIAARVADRLTRQFPGRAIRADFPADFPAISADERRIGQVITNLVSNALKYSSADSEVVVSGKAASDRVTIRVEDHGFGIDQKDLPYVFDRFYRGPEIAKRTKGAGLGLYLSKAVIEAHGGRIWIESKPGKGTRVFFSLPRSRETTR